jgi:hypothetical protein
MTMDSLYGYDDVLTLRAMALPKDFHPFVIHLLPEVCLYWRILGRQFYPLEVVT